MNILSAPGDNSGPCLKLCSHIKCQEIRQMAAKACPICKKPIGYKQPFFVYEERLFHACCLRAEKEGN